MPRCANRGNCACPGTTPIRPPVCATAPCCKTKGVMTARALRGEFRRNPYLPMLVGGVFASGVRAGVARGDYVYRKGDFLSGPGARG